MVMEGWGGVDGFSETQAPSTTTSLLMPLDDEPARVRRAMPGLRETLADARRLREILQP
jgi:hypothetical protein